MNLFIQPISGNYQAVHKFQCDYLDEETYEQFLSRINGNPTLYLTAYVDGDLVGVCYGHLISDTVACLQGIATQQSPEFARQGIGTSLLRAFENNLRELGVSRLEVGSAEDEKVESFYLKNGFMPFEMVVKDGDYQEIARVQVNSYDQGLKERAKLKVKYQPHEVIFIFGKGLKEEIN